MCPRQGSNFLLLRQKKVTKEKASRIRRPSAALRARCVARARREAQKLAALKHLRFLIRRSLRYSPPHYGGGAQTAEPVRASRVLVLPLFPGRHMFPTLVSHEPPFFHQQANDAVAQVVF